MEVPDGRPPLAGIADAVGSPTPRARLDAVDLRLLELLAADSRVSQRALARQLHMSPPAIGERVARLERAGVIRSYTVDIDWAALGYGTRVYLAVTASTDRAPILHALHAVPEVEGVAVVTGSMDLLARVRVRDHDHLRKLLFERVWTIKGVERTETFLCLAEMPAKDFAGELLADMEKELEGGT
ncbi:MAG: Lrp/AsnC family transcriptional regulator [Acidimicrobiales bacterium]